MDYRMTEHRLERSPEYKIQIHLMLLLGLQDGATKSNDIGKSLDDRERYVVYVTL
jgi:hypothetical protein